MGLIVVVGCGGQGATGMNAFQYNSVSRYMAITTTGEEVWMTSSANVYSFLSWSRSGTSLTVTHFNHGLAIGDMVIVKNAHVSQVNGPITAVTANTFTITVQNTGDVSGASALYSAGFSYAHLSNPKTGGQIFLPHGTANSDIQMLSMRIRTGLRAGTTYDLIVPVSTHNSFGANTSLSDTYIPNYSVRQDVDFLSAIGATITTNVDHVGDYTKFRFANLGLGNQSRYIILDF